MISKKQILLLMVLAVIVLAACSEKPTEEKSLTVVEKAGRTPIPKFDFDNNVKKLNIDYTKGLIQFKDITFKSGGYYLNGDRSKIIYFYAYVKIDNSSKPYIRVITKDIDGNIVEEEGKFYTVSNQTGVVYNLEGNRYSSNKIKAEAIFIEEGYLRIKFNNYGTEIVYAYRDEKVSEEIGNGSYIPEIYHGNYVYLRGNGDKIKSAYVGTILYEGNMVDGIEYDRSFSIEYVGQWTWFVTEPDTKYLGNNTWEETFTTGWDMRGGAWKTEPCVKKFTLNERGQRILTTTSDFIGENLLIHEDDINK